MSHSTIIHVFPNEKIECGQEFSNSWGAAPVVWDSMCQKYLGAAPLRYLYGLDKLWPLWEDKNIPLHHRSVLMMTFDHAYVSKKNYQQAASDIRAFLKDFPQNPEHVNHWPAIAEYFDSNPDIPAIGFWHTSVSENPFNGRWNEEKEEYDSPDWVELTDIYEALSAL